MSTLGLRVSVGQKDWIDQTKKKDDERDNLLLKRNYVASSHTKAEFILKLTLQTK